MIYKNLSVMVVMSILTLEICAQYLPKNYVKKQLLCVLERAPCDKFGLLMKGTKNS